MGRPCIKTIFWDVGVVLFSEAQLAGREFSPVRKLLGISIDKSNEIFFKLWPNEIRLGRISEDDYWREILRQSRNRPKVKEVKELYRNCIRANEKLFDLVKKLSGEYNQYVLSNHGKEWMEYLVKRWQLKNWFKDIFCSGWLGVGKPDKKFYEVVLKTSKANPAECLYIDDVAEYFETSNLYGINGLVYKNNRDTISKMKNLGIL